MLPRPLLLLLLLAAATIVGTARFAACAPTLVFILAGQSNMGGRGGATSGTWDGVVPPECAPPARPPPLPGPPLGGGPRAAARRHRRPQRPRRRPRHALRQRRPGLPRRPARLRHRPRPLRAGRHAHRQLVAGHRPVRQDAHARQGRRGRVRRRRQAGRPALVPGGGRHHQARGRRGLHGPHGGHGPRRPPRPRRAQPARHPGWDRNRAGEVHRPGEESSEGGQASEPHVCGCQGATHRQRLHPSYH